MKKILPLISYITLSFCANVLGQTKIAGSVFDAVTKEPLIGATVVVHGTTLGTMTSANGRFEFISTVACDTACGNSRQRRFRCCLPNGDGKRHGLVHKEALDNF